MGDLAILFPGQGAQSVGMGRDLYDANSEVRELYAQANEIVGYDLTKICMHGPAELLDTTIYSQPSIFLNSMAALLVLRRDEPDLDKRVVATAGLSLGEYTALTFAGAFSFADGLRLVQACGEAMQKAAELVPSGMVGVIGIPASRVEELCEQVCGLGVLKVANYLCPNNTVVSGENAACEKIVDLAREAGAIKVVPLAVAGAFHTPLMNPAKDSLKTVLDHTAITKPRIPVVSNVDVKAHDDPDDIRNTLLAQLGSPVLWEESMRLLLNQGVDTFYEVGPGRVLRGLMKRISRQVKMN